MTPCYFSFPKSALFSSANLWHLHAFLCVSFVPLAVTLQRSVYVCVWGVSSKETQRVNKPSRESCALIARLSLTQPRFICLCQADKHHPGPPTRKKQPQRGWMISCGERKRHAHVRQVFTWADMEQADKRGFTNRMCFWGFGEKCGYGRISSDTQIWQPSCSYNIESCEIVIAFSSCINKVYFFLIGFGSILVVF